MSAPATDYGYDVTRVDPHAPARLRPDDPVKPRKFPVRGAARWVLIAVSILLALGVLALFIYQLVLPMGVGTFLVAFTAALVPVAIVFAAVWWLDRYTPQTASSLIFAFLWGALGSVALTLLVGTYIFDPLVMPEDYSHPASVMFFGAVVQAPVVEESMKSLGLVLLLIGGWITGRRHIAGPLDGAVYAALMAGGFAFTENILYFADSFAQAQAAGETSVFWTTFVLRGLLSPFAHSSFTCLCGIGIGIGMERRSWLLIPGLGLGGLAAGMLLHALWNGSTFFIDVDPESPWTGFIRYYLIVQVPIFLILLAIVVFLRWRERRIIRRELSDYGRAGWYAPSEVTMLVSMGKRRKAERWAGKHGAVARMGMRSYIQHSITLAMERHSAFFASRRTARMRRRERELLTAITADRRLIGALTEPVTRASSTAPPTA